ncbi:MAG: hypothetical protein GEU76_14600 [Alphaproteobacteria bacterium]|nr:hypothetical protein [Alphaproteobacteria bacterium]
MTIGIRHALHRISLVPEFNVAGFGFLLNLPWEFLQAPFFEGLPTKPHWEAVQLCTLAAVGDAAMLVAAFWITAAAARSRSWILRLAGSQVALFMSIGLALTVVFERLATGILGRWTYSDAMPILPAVGVGILPLIQWIMLPPVLLWLVRRQLTAPPAT